MFYSFLTSKRTNDEKYEDVAKVQDKFEMEMAKDYPNSYLKSDVLLLAGDVFDKET